MNAETTGRRLGITGHNTAPVKVFSRGSADTWRFEDTWCDSKLDVPVNGPQWSKFFTEFFFVPVDVCPILLTVS